MKRILASFCVVFLSFLECSGQETTQSQSSTDAATKIDWDTTTPPLTTSVADTQTENVISSRANADYSTIFSNPWGPMLMPMKVSPYGEGIYNRKTRYEVKDIVDVNPFLRRPDAYYPTDWNDTISSEYGRYSMSSDYQPFSPPGFFYSQPMQSRDPKNMRYPDQIDSMSSPQVTKSQDASETQANSAASPSPDLYRSPFSNPFANRGNGHFFSYPPLDYFWRNRADVRNQENTVPSTPYPYYPGFYPPGGPQIYPEVNVFVRPPTGEEGSGSVPQENIAERRESLQTTGHVLPTVPTGAPIPLQPNLPLPPNPFPFGYPPPGLQRPFPIPPGIFPRPTPILPNILPPPNNLVDAPIPNTPALQHKPADASTENLPQERIGSVPDVVNVDVFDPETAKGPSGNLPYKFGYDMNDGLGNDQHREESANEAGVVTGSYGYRDLNGVYRMVNYIADKDGFRALVKTNEPGAANPGSADVVVMAERPPLQTVAEGLRRSDIGVAVTGDQSEMEIDSIEKK